GVAVVGRTAFQHVRDEHVLALASDRLDDLREELTRPTDEGEALFVLVSSRCLADEHQLRLRAPLSENDVRPGLRELAARTVLEKLREPGEAGQRPGGQGGRRRGGAGRPALEKHVPDAEVAEELELVAGRVFGHAGSLTRRARGLQDFEAGAEAEARAR